MAAGSLRQAAQQNGVPERLAECRNQIGRESVRSAGASPAIDHRLCDRAVGKAADHGRDFLAGMWAGLDRFVEELAQPLIHIHCAGIGGWWGWDGD